MTEGQTVANDVTSHDAGKVGAAAGESGANFGNEYEDEEEEDEEEAEEIARRLKEQLWADISKAQAAQATPSARPLAATVTAPPAGHAATVTLSRKHDAALQTMKGILAITVNDALAHYTLASTVVPGTNNDNVLNVLNEVVRTGSISKKLAKALAPVLVSLARSDTLFATMRHSNAPAIQLDKGKRKRDENEEEQRQNDTRAFKRPNVVYHDFQRQITEAVKIVYSALSTNSPANGFLDPSVISSVQLHLHQLFLFSMTSSAGGGPEMNALQEIGGLIQVLGVLSGIQIGPTSTPNHAVQQAPGSTSHASHPWIPQGTHPNSSTPFNDIGTAVYPCLVPGCRKIFARLYNLRAHQRIHAVHRPFRCTVCPASFARNHDLKRHAKLHEKKAWQCAGCDKMFSRRDAIKRHKNSSATRGSKGEACVNGAIKEVVLDKEGDEDAIREGRRTRMWADIVAGNATPTTYYGHADDGHMEEGEVHGDVIRQMQAAVLSLHTTLKGHVSSALGTDHAAPPLHLDPTGGQATLAGVIARAQMQSLAQAQIQGLGPSGDVGGVVHPEGSCISYPGDKSSMPLDSARTVDSEARPDGAVAAPQLSLYGLSEEQTRLLEQAIANAASAAQAQAEAEAAMEEEDEEDEDEEGQPGSNEMDDTLSSTITQLSVAPGE